jgi:hypothetical protein
MPTFIDESGDTGHSPGSLPFFRLVAVWVPTHGDAEHFREAVRSLRLAHGLKSSHEFKFVWTHDHPEYRRAFFQAALATPFQFAACAIDKTAPAWRAAPPATLHWAATVCLAASLRPVYQEAERSLPPRSGKPALLHDLVIVDDNHDRDFLKAVTSAFRGLRSDQQPSASVVGKVKFRGSGPDEMIQLADMLCGAVGASISVDGDPTWFRMIEERCAGLHTLP